MVNGDILYITINLYFGLFIMYDDLFVYLLIIKEFIQRDSFMI
jgi:hypothetical protein